jgi:hypothetical protein
VNARLPSWHAKGLVEKAWLRIDPPKRDELARRMNVEGSDLSARNNSTDEKPKRMTIGYAKRIAEAVRQDDETFTVADLGAPSSVVAEAEPTVLDRLQELETKYEVQRGALEAVEGVADRLEKRLVRLQNRVRRAEQKSLGASP